MVVLPKKAKQVARQIMGCSSRSRAMVVVVVLNVFFVSSAAPHLEETYCVR